MTLAIPTRTPVTIPVSFTATRWTGHEPYQFLSRAAMSRYTGTQPYGVISITDPDAPKCHLTPDPLRRGLLRLQFWDLEDEAWTGKNPWGLDAKDRFTQAHATQIHNFVRATRHNKVTIVHCEAGISRSSGVAAALATAANCPGTDRYFTTPPAHPNWTVYRTVLRTLRPDLTTPQTAPPGQYGAPGLPARRGAGRMTKYLIVTALVLGALSTVAVLVGLQSLGPYYTQPGGRP